MHTLAVTAKPGEITPLPVILFCLLWSSAFAAAKVALGYCPPLLLLGTRFLLAGALILSACALFGRLERLSWRDLGVLAFVGVLNNACYLGLSYEGMTTVSSGFTAVVISANPLLTALLAAPFLGEQLTGRKLAGLLLGMVGVALVVRSRLGSGAEDVTGTLFVLGALVTLAIATLVFKRAGTGTSLWMSSGIQSLAGGLALLPVALLTEDVGAVHMSTPLIFSFLYLTLGASVGGFSLWFFILKRASATKASALHFLMPPLGLMFGWLVLGETVPPLDLLGIVPIVLGIRLVTTAPQKR